MKKIFTLITISLVIMHQISYSQVKTKTAQEWKTLPDFFNILEVNNQLYGATWALGLANSSAGIDASKYGLSPNTVTSNFNQIISKSRPDNTSILYPVYPLYVKNKSKIIDYLSNTKSMGRVPIIYFINENSIPIYFTNKSNSLNLVLDGLAYDKVFNTLQTTARKRAVAVVSEMIIPGIKNLKPLLSIPNLQSISITVMFASEDFTERSGSGMKFYKPESITVCGPITLFKQMTSKTITEDLFIKKAEFYLNDGEEESSIKKVELKIE